MVSTTGASTSTAVGCDRYFFLTPPYPPAFHALLGEVGMLASESAPYLVDTTVTQPPALEIVHTPLIPTPSPQLGSSMETPIQVDSEIEGTDTEPEIEPDITDPSEDETPVPRIIFIRGPRTLSTARKSTRPPGKKPKPDPEATTSEPWGLSYGHSNPTSASHCKQPRQLRRIKLWRVYEDQATHIRYGRRAHGGRRLAATKPAESGGFAVESGTSVRLHQCRSGANRSAARTNTRLRNKQSTNQVAMAWSQPVFDPSMAAQQASPIGARQLNTMAQTHAQAVISPFATPYPQQGTANRPGGEKGLPLSGGIKNRPIPPQFKFSPVPRYSGETDPKEFLSIYESVIEAAHGDENTKAKPIAFIHGSNCAMSLSLTFEAPMRPGESIREYMHRFSQARCQVQDITEASVINAALAGLLEGELTRKIANKEPQTLEHLLRIIDGFARGEEDFKRRQAIQAEYDKPSIATAQPQAQVQVAEPPPLAGRQPQPAIQGQPPRQGQAPMTWRKFRTDRAGKAMMAVEEVQALHKEFDAQQASNHQQPVRKKVRNDLYCAFHGRSSPTTEQCQNIRQRGNAQLSKHLVKQFKYKHPQSNNTKMRSEGAVHNVEAELHDRPKHAPKPTPHGKIVKVQIDDADPAKLVSLGDGMGEEEAEGILAVLKKNFDIFAWSPDEVGGVSTDLIMHHLAVKPDAKSRKMPFGLRNAGATIARLVYKVLCNQLGRNVEAYVEHIVVKSCKAFDHASDLQETFDNLRAARIKLNPEKCVFGVRAGKLLGFLVSKSGIEANNEKIDAIQQMKPPSSVHEKPVYFVSEALQGAKTRYIEMEKLAYALVMASRKLKHYFQAHKVIVPSQYPLGEILRGKEVSGRLNKWAAELSLFDLHFVARTAVKSQVLADFVAEWTPVFASEPEPVEQFWVMCSDGSWSHKGAGIAAVLISPNGVPIRGQNEEADALAKSAACGGPHLPGIFFEVLHAPGEEMAKEVHQGLCGAHQARRTVASKVFRQGVYWPTVLKVCAEQIKKCESCQRHGRSQTAPHYDLQPIAPIWPFTRWGLDIIGPFPVARNGYKFVIVAVEYFSRWIEAEPLGAITSATVQKFVWKNIICRFGVPKEFITDNGKQFDSEKFREMCEGLNLEIRFASVAHPQSNGAAERTNGKILEALKKRLEGAAKGKWLEEMLSVLWALRTTPARPTKFSPFMLLYDNEAMTPAELGANSPRVMFSGDEGGREVSLELLEGVRVEALEHMRKYAVNTSATYNKKVRPTELLPGHLVLRKKANPVAVGKLESKWEGPFLIKRKSRTGSFRLATMEGEEFDHSWNAASLKRLYV
uniref:OSIGBa0101A01.5 protein n=1 Tax=Oryza sativa TaxID=4530 RepID=Q01LW6_ORYSA|nr:OSIGBa0101A01.5 [Oryza sativa]